MNDRDRIADLEARVADLERKRVREEHVHRYRYSKSTTTDNDPGYFFWSWTCLDDEGDISKVCPAPSGWTNHRSGLPDHFPDSLR